MQEFRGKYEWDNQIQELATTKFGFDSFRVGQRECINAALKGKDILVLMPTGSGKSLIFQLVALYEHQLHGSVTVIPHIANYPIIKFQIVVSPTKALINEQTDKLQKINIEVEKLTSDDNDLATIINSIAHGHYHLLILDSQKNKVPALIYTTPEKLVQHRIFSDTMKKLYDKGLFRSGKYRVIAGK